MDENEIKIEDMWGPLPTYANYVDIDELYDWEEIQELYLQACAKRGW